MRGLSNFSAVGLGLRLTNIHVRVLIAAARNCYFIGPGSSGVNDYRAPPPTSLFARSSWFGNRSAGTLVGPSFERTIQRAHFELSSLQNRLFMLAAMSGIFAILSWKKMHFGMHSQSAMGPPLQLEKVLQMATASGSTE